MKKNLSIILLLLSFNVFASGGVELQDADVDVSDSGSIQRGAKHYVDYCLGCHSAKHIRYKRIAMDLGVEENKILDNIAPVGAGIYDQMNTAMNGHDSSKWFGTQPPDLSLIARSRGADWLYTYLKSFYKDDAPTGTNNLVFEDVGMPNVLWKLQGIQAPVYETVDGREVIGKLVMEKAGTLSEKEFDKFVTDLVNFLVYIGEPVQLERQSMGKYVLFFLFMFIVIAYLLKREYWKDVH
ncbi:MAG: cytochrome c1 [Methylococcaceae bacterium]|nr:cytochrome c1 [Methylococcaceae bacterium]